MLGENHVDTANAYNVLGSVLIKKGDTRQAVEYYNKALTIKSKVLGAEHLDTINLYNNLANAYRSNKDYRQAIELYNKVCYLVSWHVYA